jgi:hypothetical protein
LTQPECSPCWVAGRTGHWLGCQPTGWPGTLVTNGNIHWIAAGGGILHIEAPPEEVVVKGGLFHGFQLWVNLPARLKMTRPATRTSAARR